MTRRTVGWIGGFALVAVVLSLSDRAPGIARGGGAVLEEIWHRIEVAFAIDVDRGAIPWSFDEIGHLVLWGGGMLVLGLALRGRRRSDRLAVALFGASLLLEVLQALITARRSLSLGDAAANGLGIMLGLCVVVVAEMVWPVRSPAPGTG